MSPLELDEERLLLRQLAEARTRVGDLERELQAPRFGWTREPAPHLGIIETDGFIVRGAFMGNETHSMYGQTIGPGLVDASVHEIPTGTRWRHPPTSTP